MWERGEQEGSLLGRAENFGRREIETGTKKRGPGGGKMLGEDWRKLDEDRGEEWKTNAVDENDVDHAEDTTCLKWARPREPGVTGFAFDLVPRIHCHELCHASVVVPVYAETPAYA
ncbi:hypothetical protein K0M31_014102 [Melipona bicolor]|uniref:Uncharacterized protein n=1 Tax=Melipona bicolor TaxID=60889 RepID=A0AA40G8K5_9HYME|nr:hypothetical protein K0M31_014102 [Melipona bicolor]